MLAVRTGIDVDTPLHLVTFCAVDLESTGGSPNADAITEIGAVKYRAGERVGTFHSLVNPGVAIPRSITYLTGLDDVVVAEAPPVESLLPSLMEFLNGAVFVAHNARFDFSFLNAALRRAGYDPLPPPPVCTAKLARRVVGPDVSNVRLETLARYFRASERPAHRALPDAEACADVLHGLLDLGGRLGILTLGDLFASVKARGQPHYAKIRLADRLPHAPGVYLFRGRGGRVLYVGKATDLRQRVKSYFYGDERRSIGELLAQTESVEGRPCPGELDALVLESRLIARHEPPHNRRGKTWRRYAYLKVDLAEAWPRIKVVREPKGPGAFLGPFPNAATARLAQEALEDAFPIRRCTRRMAAGTRFSACALAGLGRCLAPCQGRVCSRKPPWPGTGCGPWPRRWSGPGPTAGCWPRAGWKSGRLTAGASPCRAGRCPGRAVRRTGSRARGSGPTRWPRFAPGWEGFGRRWCTPTSPRPSRSTAAPPWPECSRSCGRDLRDPPRSELRSWADRKSRPAAPSGAAGAM